MSDLQTRIKHVQERISRAAARSGRDAVGLVAVTKTVPAETVREACVLGLTVFGENRVQEALPKVEAVPEADWHFIGRLQTNKVKDVLGKFTLIHSLDRWKLAKVIQKEAAERDLSVRVLVQVNIAGEKQKGGIAPSELADFLCDVSTLTHLRVAGLMAIPPFTDHPEEVRPYFKEMAHLFQNLRIPGIGMEILSMGMTGDFEVAVEEGANLVRIGSALFGGRN
ncbi:MAG: YggS family pyridoxal phosphate-dependent enzyme [Bacillota bacterium]|nr:YggS family pyridoxal phosphate-dependent enzyme [Bacillota bacterium]MDW7684000.1 YggS family pyridoxal phosphate-dependent enzyme [Bacillota bacterium]